MTGHLMIPNAAVKYILFQRTQYLRLPHTYAYRALAKVLPVSMYNRAVAIEAAFSGARVKALYQEDMCREYMSVRAFLPQKCSSVLDIGCGVAGFAFFLHQHYADTPLELYLLDKTGVEPRLYYQFEKRGAFYNSLDVAKKLLTSSGVDAGSIHLIEANDENDIGVKCKVELVTSLISWGFHYPVATYLDKVHEVLADHGVVILDIRKNTDGKDILHKRFSDIKVILEHEKFLRVAARK